MKTVNLSPFEYQTQIFVRSPVCQSFYVDHLYPPILFWKNILKKYGFEISELYGDTNGAAFDEKVSPMLVCEAIKQNSETFYIANQHSKNIFSFYEKIAINYESFSSKADYIVPKWVQKLCTSFHGLSPTVLDLGCGNGLIGRTLLKAGVQPLFMFGLDVSSEMAEQTLLTTCYTNAAQWDLSDGLPLMKSMSFDIVTAFGLAEFIENCETLLKDIVHVLTLGGELWISFEVAQENERCIEIDLGSFKIKRFPYTKENAAKLITEAGLEIMEIEETVGYISPTTNQKVFYILCRAIKQRLS